MPKKNGLGKGLVSLMGEANAEVGSTAPDNMLPIARIKANPNQPRKNFDEAKLKELADSIKQNGILQPLLQIPCRRHAEGSRHRRPAEKREEDHPCLRLQILES